MIYQKRTSLDMRNRAIRLAPMAVEYRNGGNKYFYGICIVAIGYFAIQSVRYFL